MRKTLRFNIIFLITIFLFSGIKSNGQYETKKINQIISVLEKIHVDPVGINDTLSNRIFNNFISSLDPGEFIFLEEDITSFNKYKDSLDDQIKANDFPFLTLVGNRYKKRLSQIDSIAKVVINKELVFSNKDTITFNASNEVDYKKTLSELTIKWENWVKYRILKYLYSSTPTLNISNKDSVTIALKRGSEKIKEEIECIVDSYEFEDESYFNYAFLGDFLDAVALSYDPHSSFFTEEAKASFDNSLSKESMDFGIFLEKEDDVVKVESMIPGGPAWKSNQINKGDIIQKIVYNDTSEINLTCQSAYDIEDILLSSYIDNVIITLIKKSGQTIEVSLTKEIIKTDDNVMTAIVLNGDKKIGYLPIPSFYSESESEMVKGCANDVAKEILKMKKDSIEGLIIDLRFNGGGSLSEAIDFAGIFIDVGPIGTVVAAKGKPKLMKDMNRGTAYRGPLVILINGASASASEVLAGSLQLHNRALIVGSPSYGKSTGQIVVPIDTNLWYGSEQPEEFVKVTTIKLYDVKNGSHQKSGIQPDIQIPDIWQHFIPSEFEENYALNNDSINKKIYLKPYPELPIAELKIKNKNRVDQNKVFQYILTANDSIKIDNEIEDKIALTVEEYWKYATIRSCNYDYLEKNILNKTTAFTAENLSYNKEIDQLNDRFHDKSERLFKTLEEDVSLNETYKIITDLISILE